MINFSPCNVNSLLCKKAEKDILEPQHFVEKAVGIGMFATVNSLGVYALSGFAVRVEADVSGGLPQFAIVGLPDSAVKESADRVRSALKNLSFT